jgi:hypothetical protein
MAGASCRFRRAGMGFLGCDGRCWRLVHVGHFDPGGNSLVMRSMFVESVAAVPPPFSPDAARARGLAAR